jgi:hypothetical protein
MSIIYDMASGRSESSPEKSNTTAVRNELIPALAVRESSSCGSHGQSKGHAIHLISAVLKKVGAS